MDILFSLIFNFMYVVIYIALMWFIGTPNLIKKPFHVYSKGRTSSKSYEGMIFYFGILWTFLLLFLFVSYLINVITDVYIWHGYAFKHLGIILLNGMLISIILCLAGYRVLIKLSCEHQHDIHSKEGKKCT